MRDIAGGSWSLKMRQLWGGHCGWKHQGRGDGEVFKLDFKGGHHNRRYHIVRHHGGRCCNRRHCKMKHDEGILGWKITQGEG